MSSKHYVTITHYKEREFYFLNHAVQTNDGFIAKDSEQFHESEKEKFIERIRTLQTQYPTHQVISLSLSANQIVKEKEDPNQASAKIAKENYVLQEKIDIGNTPVTLYFSPFSILYEEYKHKLDDKLTLLIGLFDRKLYMMFVSKEKIHESWTLGTRGLTEKQVANRVYKSMKAYYKISFKFADHIEMLLSDDSPKLLKVLREELSMSIFPTQKTIHALLHNMGSDSRKFIGSYIKSYLSTNNMQKLNTEGEASFYNAEQTDSLKDLKLNTASNINANNQSSSSFVDKIGSLRSISLFSFLPLLAVLLVGGYFTLQNNALTNKLTLIEHQSYAQTDHTLLAQTSKDVFSAMGKSAELTFANISNEKIELKGMVWGIEPLRNKLIELYPNGEFVIKPLENFMTEFSFKSKI